MCRINHTQVYSALSSHYTVGSTLVRMSIWQMLGIGCDEVSGHVIVKSSPKPRYGTFHL